MTGPVRIMDLGQGLTRIAINNPPVNALDLEVRQGLLAAFDQAENDPAVRLILLGAEGRTFPAGADIKEFRGMPQDPWLPEVCNRIESCTKPVVAVMHGTALGGGFELALAAHYRIGLANGYVGLPEVTLGLLPGAGGTQRLPRLVGGEAALEIMLAGKPLTIPEAERLGAIDRVVRGDLDSAAQAYGLELLDQGAGPRPTRDRTQGLADARGFMAALARHRPAAQAAPIPGPARIVACTEAALLLPFEVGCDYELTAFEDCLASEQSQALRHAFFAERATARIPEAKIARPHPVSRVALIGAGDEMVAWTVMALEAPFPVTLVAPDPDALVERVDAVLAAAVAQRRMAEGQRGARIARLTASRDPAALKGADVVLVRLTGGDASALTTVAKHADEAAVLAVHGARAEDLAAFHAAQPILGLSLPAPAHEHRLAEVILRETIDPEAVLTLADVLRKMGRVVVRAKGGSLGATVMAAALEAGAQMLARGATPYQIDAAMKDAGFDEGLYQRLDRTGQVVRAGPLGEALRSRGLLGRAVGLGFYRYDQGQPPAEDRQVLALLRGLQAAQDGPARSFGADEIRQRILAAMANAGARLVARGAALRPGDVDVACMLGQGVPRWRGGPMMIADQTGLLAVQKTLKVLAEEDRRFWSPVKLIGDLIKNGRRFGDLNG